MNKFIKLALTSIVTAMSMASMSYAAPNGVDVVPTVTITAIYAPPTNAPVGNVGVSNSIAANPNRTGYIIWSQSAATATNNTGIYLSSISNGTPYTSLGVVPSGGSYTNFSKPVYQGQIYFDNAATNYGGILNTSQCTVVEFSAAP